MDEKQFAIHCQWQQEQTKHLKSINTAVSFMAIMLLLAIVLAACNALL